MISELFYLINQIGPNPTSSTKFLDGIASLASWGIGFSQTVSNHYAKYRNQKCIFSSCNTWYWIKCCAVLIRPQKSFNKNLKIQVVDVESIKKEDKIKKATKDEPIIESDMLEDSDLDCKYCSKICISPSMLKNHFVKHTKEECNECGTMERSLELHQYFTIIEGFIILLFVKCVKESFHKEQITLNTKQLCTISRTFPQL